MNTREAASAFPTSSLSRSLIGMDKIQLGVYINYTFFIF